MAPNPIVQRLIAAGASPSRAQQFATQYIAAKTKAGVKPKDISDIFNEDVIQYVTNKYPTLWRPPTADSPEIDSYISGVHGPNTVSQILTNAWNSVAPDYYKAWSSGKGKTDSANKAGQIVTNKTLDEYVAGSVALGQDVSKIKNDLASGIVIDSKGNSITGVLQPSEFGNRVDKISSQYYDAGSKIPKAKEEWLKKNDKNWVAKIAPPSFKYGEKTDYAAGTIDFRTQPTVVRDLNKIIDPNTNDWTKLLPAPKTQEFTGKNLVSPYGAMPESKPNPIGQAYKVKERELLTALNNDRNTPYLDEKNIRVANKALDKKGM